jgi:transcriptional regulator of acetoin/glycerol metabolism
LAEGEGQHVDRVLAAVADPRAAAVSSVAASWARSVRLYGLDPADARGPQTATGLELSAARVRLEPVLRHAGPVLDRLFQAVGGSGGCVLLTDATGIPVERRGAPGDDADFRRMGLWTGAVWSEQAGGTNGIGTCLAEGRALTIHKDQHFHARNIALSCTVAPIHDAQGRVLAALDVSSCRADLSEGLVGLIAAAVSEAARRLEARLFQDAFAGARIVLVPDAGSSAPALLAVDGDDLVIGATRAARQMLALQASSVNGTVTAGSLLGSGPARSGPGALEEAERAALHRALSEARGNVSLAARTLNISRATLHRKMTRFGLARG